MKFSVPISVGELLDKISILQIKNEKIKDQNKLVNIHLELNCLEAVLLKCEIEDTICPKILEDLRQKLKKVNEKLWTVEDELRLRETKSDFSDEFVDLARSVYQLNDERAKIKRKINDLSGSEIIEEKSYKG